MPKVPTHPTLYDDCKRISISKLKEWGYLRPGQIKAGAITWSRNDIQTASISIAVNTCNAYPYIQLSYNYNDKPIDYQVQIVSNPSNLGRGSYLYFKCPQTGKRCRNLYLIDGYFFHRSAFKGCMYEKQTYSSNKRQMDRVFEKIFGTEKLFEKINSKHFKTHYGGKPTKSYKLIWGRIQAASKYSEADVLRYLKK
jgi:hypothetical protein